MISFKVYFAFIDGCKVRFLLLCQPLLEHDVLGGLGVWELFSEKHQLRYFRNITTIKVVDSIGRH